MVKKALFLDRDGIINVEKNYLYKIEDFELVDGIIDVCKYYQKQGFIIVVVTNQSGVSRGYYSEDDFKILSEWMIEYFGSLGVKIERIYHCPHSENDNCECRKPKSGMFLEAKKYLDIDMANSVMIGDSERDIIAAKNADVGYSILLGSGESSADRVVKSLRELL